MSAFDFGRTWDNPTDRMLINGALVKTARRRVSRWLSLWLPALVLLAVAGMLAGFVLAAVRIGGME